jgi:hypothetical protein
VRVEATKCVVDDRYWSNSFVATGKIIDDIISLPQTIKVTLVRRPIIRVSEAPQVRRLESLCEFNQRHRRQRARVTSEPSTSGGAGGGRTPHSKL